MSSAHAQPQPPADPSGPLAVVAVDDFDDIRRLAKLVLELSGRFVVVAEAANGRDAIQAAQEHHPDLILLDLAMPVMSGLEALPAIRAASPATRVVVFSGFEQHSVSWGEARVDGFVLKGDLVANLVGALLAAADAPAA